MTKIGLIDYYLAEWHAENYPAWLRRYNSEHGTDFEIAFAYGELEASPRSGKTTAEWCREFGAAACGSVAEVCEKSDVLMILAPSNPEKHLAYAKIVLPYGKPTYIDKTFAPDFATATEIFALAKAYGTPFFSSSALRFATELDGIAHAGNVIVTGGGSDFAEYLIHPLEMAVKLLGAGALRVRTERQGGQYLVRAEWTDGRFATVVFAPKAEFSAEVEAADGTHLHKSVRSEYFYALISDICRFWKERTPSFDPAETLEIAALREAALNSRGEWVPVLREGAR